MKKKLMMLTCTAMLVGSVAWVPQADAAAWNKCKMCHNFTSKNKMGPGLAGVIGRKAGSKSDFHYTFVRYIKGDGWTWDEAHLRAFMCNSTKAIRKFTNNSHARTAMPAQRVCDKKQQDEVLAKLKEVSK